MMQAIHSIKILIHFACPCFQIPNVKGTCVFALSTKQHLTYLILYLQVITVLNNTDCVMKPLVNKLAAQPWIYVYMFAGLNSC
jgi:hypothetical protein